MKYSQALNQTTRPVSELFFIIAPPRHIMSDVSVLKDDVHYLIGHQLEDRHTLAHVSLFRYNDEFSEDMIRHVEEKAATLEPFNVFLKDFGVFYTGSKRTVYMDIVNKWPIQEIFETMIREDASYVPHIPIARNLSNPDFLRCWPYLKGLNYSNQHFLCDRITVLARGERQWTHYRDIMLG